MALSEMIMAIFQSVRLMLLEHSEKVLRHVNPVVSLLTGLFLVVLFLMLHQLVNYSCLLRNF